MKPRGIVVRRAWRTFGSVSTHTQEILRHARSSVVGRSIGLSDSDHEFHSLVENLVGGLLGPLSMFCDASSPDRSG